MEFSLKPITFFGRTCVIICQNENGPCPLLAIANILLLQNRITVDPDRGILSLAELVQIVANEILEKIDNSSLPEHVTLVESVLNILPKLAHGLDLNVQFTGVDKFEFTEEISVFDALGIRLLHGWLCNPADTEELAVLGNLSYNHVLFRIVEYKSLSNKETKPADSSGTEEKESGDALPAPAEEQSNSPVKTRVAQTTLQYEGAVLERFLQKTASQFTYNGMLALYNAMQDRQFAVFFRNNHFSALYFYNGQLFTLVTDLGYRHEPTVVWELLNSIDGDCEFYNSEFAPLSSLTPLSSPGFFATFPEVGALCPSSPVTFPSAGAGGTVAAPPVGYKYAPTTCAPPVRVQPNSPSPVVSATSSAVDVGDGSTPSKDSGAVGREAQVTTGALEVETGPTVVLGEANSSSATVGTMSASGEEPARPPQESALAISALGDSYEIVDAKSVSEVTVTSDANEAKVGDTTVLATTTGNSAELGECAPAITDAEVHVLTVTQPAPHPALVQAPTLAPPPVSAPAHEYVPISASSYDADLRLAMELQAQEDANARAHSATAETRWAAPTQKTSSMQQQPQDFLSQEESDRQHALMLHYEELEAQEQLHRLQQQHQQHRPAAAPPPPAQRHTTYAGSTSSGFPYNQSRERQQSDSTSNKKDNCCIS